jgi:EAL domain-containing protein (putative c-di-GMP-specific phosphodiesterase class I)
VRDIVDESHDRSIGRAIIAMGQSPNAQEIAEGKETQAQWTVLRQLGCQLCQGYLFGKPVAIEALFENRRGRVVACDNECAV